MSEDVHSQPLPQPQLQPQQHALPRAGGAVDITTKNSNASQGQQTQPYYQGVEQADSITSRANSQLGTGNNRASKPCDVPCDAEEKSSDKSIYTDKETLMGYKGDVAANSFNASNRGKVASSEPSTKKVKEDFHKKLTYKGKKSIHLQPHNA